MGSAAQRKVSALPPSDGGPGQLCMTAAFISVIVEAIQPFVTFTGMPSRR